MKIRHRWNIKSLLQFKNIKKDKRESARGLLRFGYTCWIASFVQSLISLPEFCIDYLTKVYSYIDELRNFRKEYVDQEKDETKYETNKNLAKWADVALELANVICEMYDKKANDYYYAERFEKLLQDALSPDELTPDGGNCPLTIFTELPNMIDKVFLTLFNISKPTYKQRSAISPEARLLHRIIMSRYIKIFSKWFSFVTDENAVYCWKCHNVFDRHGSLMCNHIKTNSVDTFFEKYDEKFKPTNFENTDFKISNEFFLNDDIVATYGNKIHSESFYCEKPIDIYDCIKNRQNVTHPCEEKKRERTQSYCLSCKEETFGLIGNAYKTISPPLVQVIMFSNDAFRSYQQMHEEKYNTIILPIKTRIYKEIDLKDLIQKKSLNTKYFLSSIIVNNGLKGSSSRHYITYSRRGEKDPWYCCDGETVTNADEEIDDVLEGKTHWYPDMCFYTKKL